MFVEKGSDGTDTKWFHVDELPEATRDATLTIWEMPRQDRIDTFIVKGSRVSLSLDDGRYVVVHNHPDNGWQANVSVNCSKKDYDEICAMLRRGRIEGMKSMVTSEGTRKDCTFPQCRYSTLSFLAMVRHIRKHYRPVEDLGVKVHPGFASEERKQKRDALKDEIAAVAAQVTSPGE